MYNLRDEKGQKTLKCASEPVTYNDTAFYVHLFYFHLCISYTKLNMYLNLPIQHYGLQFHRLIDNVKYS